MKTWPLAYASALRHAVMTTMKTHQIVNIMLHFMESGLRQWQPLCLWLLFVLFRRQRHTRFIRVWHRLGERGRRHYMVHGWRGIPLHQRRKIQVPLQRNVARHRNERQDEALLSTLVRKVTVWCHNSVNYSFSKRRSFILRKAAFRVAICRLLEAKRRHIGTRLVYKQLGGNAMLRFCLCENKACFWWKILLFLPFCQNNAFQLFLFLPFC